MEFVRAIGRWTMTAFVVNTIIGAGIFALPGELTALLGRASPIAMIFLALSMAVIMACVAEVASQFTEAGGANLYVRTAFGRFLGTQIGWLELLSVTVGLAALTSLFVDNLAAFLPQPLNTWGRVILVALVIAIPMVANYRGVSYGARLNNLTTVAKLSPLVLLILFGIARFAHQPQVIHASEISSPGLSNWIRALVILLFAFGGWEDCLVPTGEIKEPHRTIPFALAAALVACTAIYTLLQFITVAAIGTKATDAPLAETASVIFGGGGAAFVRVAILVSIYGWISAAMLYSPRLAYSLASQGDFPAVFGKLHSRFRTPAAAILLYAFIGWVLAASGTFIWLVAVSSATFCVLYTGMCACLIRLRKLRPQAKAFRIPSGAVLSILGIAISLALMTGLKGREILLLCITALIATAYWLCVKYGHRTSGPRMDPTAG